MVAGPHPGRLGSYWVYQHLGNLSPAELADDEDYQKVLAADGDCWPHLIELADRADSEVDGDKGLRFSYRWDLGRSRLIMVDSRNARILDSGDRKMLGDREFAWLEAQIDDGLDELDHLVLGSSLPWLLPPAIGDLQTVNEIAANRAGPAGPVGREDPSDSRLRALGGVPEVLSAAQRPDHRRGRSRPSHGPATVSVLSGDVHHSYAARADFPGLSTRPGAPAGVLPGAQLRADLRQARVQTRLVTARGPADPALGASPRLRQSCRCPGGTSADRCSATPSPP